MLELMAGLTPSLKRLCDIDELASLLVGKRGELHRFAPLFRRIQNLGGKTPFFNRFFGFMRAEPEGVGGATGANPRGRRMAQQSSFTRAAGIERPR